MADSLNLQRWDLQPVQLHIPAPGKNRDQAFSVACPISSASPCPFLHSHNTHRLKASFTSYRETKMKGECGDIRIPAVWHMCPPSRNTPSKGTYRGARPCIPWGPRRGGAHPAGVCITVGRDPPESASSWLRPWELAGCLGSRATAPPMFPLARLAFIDLTLF